MAGVPPLVDDTDLAGFPGAPFAASLVAAAAESVRTDAGWHIAPSITSTVRVDGTGNATLLVPSLHLTEVTSVMLVSGETLDGFTWSEAGVLHRESGWPRGFRNVEVTMTHGYEACPADLFPALAFRVQRSTVNAAVGSVRLGSLSVNPSGTPSTSIAEAAQPDAVVSRYTIPPRP